MSFILEAAQSGCTRREKKEVEHSLVYGNVVELEEISSAEYLRGSEEWMLRQVALEVESVESKQGYKERIELQRKEELAGKKLHGKFLKI